MTTKAGLPWRKQKAPGLPGSLIAHLPFIYVKPARELLGNLKCSNALIEAVAKGQRNNPTIRTALAWVALETMMTKLFAK